MQFNQGQLRHVQQRISNYTAKQALPKSWGFMEHFAKLQLVNGDSIQTYSSTIRALLNKALQIAIFQLNVEVIGAIL